MKNEEKDTKKRKEKREVVAPKAFHEVVGEWLDGTSEEIPRKEELCRSQVVLYATGNCGKTSSLWLTILKLTASEPFYADVYRLFLKSIKRRRDGKVSLKDVRIAFPKCGKLIYISTIGDTRDKSEDNMYFFLDEDDHIRDKERNYYAVGGKLLKACEMSYTEWTCWKIQRKERFFVSPCHPSGGSQDATLYCSDMLIKDEYINRVAWLYKEYCPKSDSKLFSKGDMKTADEIEALFHRVVSGHLI